MIQHIVMWKFKNVAEGQVKEKNVAKAKQLLEALPGKIPEIKFMEVGVDVMRTPDSYDLVLNSRFEDAQDLDTYQRHPEHVSVAGFLKQVRMTKIVVDYEVQG